VGVFVNEDFWRIMRKVDACGLKAVQLHGHESPQLVEELGREPVQVIKVLYSNAAPAIQSAASYKASAYLVECAGGALPGGNALPWNWEHAAELGKSRPLILAGGLNPDNVSLAIQASSPDAVDVSSGVESEPGRKDISKVKRFLEAVSQSRCSRRPRRIFR
jgi:phosphoribosylanthranilate isomerase